MELPRDAGKVTVTEPPSSVREGQHRSPFTAILETFCESCVGALAAGLVDEEGECVDFAQLPLLSGGHRMQAYDVKLAGAHWQIVIRTALQKLGPHGWGNLHEMWIQTEHQGFLVRMLYEGYCLVLVCRPDALGTISERAVRQAELEIGHEAGWPIKEPERPYWRRVQVQLGRSGHPRAMRFARPMVAAEHLPPELWDERLQVLERVASGPGFEKRFHILPGGWDNPEDALALVREQTGFWYLACPLYVLDI